MTTRHLTLLVTALALSACASERITRPVAVPESPPRAVTAVGTDVIYYLDGKEITPKQVATLDPRTIDTVEVFKGESARKMLGDRAAYGVIMITSKTVAPAR